MLFHRFLIHVHDNSVLVFYIGILKSVEMIRYKELVKIEQSCGDQNGKGNIKQNSFVSEIFR